MKPFIFKETQKFTQLWIWMLLVVVAVIVLLSIINLEDLDLSDKLIPSGIVGLVFVLFLSLTLKTTIDSKSLSFSYFPFVGKKRFGFNDIETMALI